MAETGLTPRHFDPWTLLGMTLGSSRLRYSAALRHRNALQHHCAVVQRERPARGWGQSPRLARFGRQRTQELGAGWELTGCVDECWELIHHFKWGRRKSHIMFQMVAACLTSKDPVEGNQRVPKLMSEDGVESLGGADTVIIMVNSAKASVKKGQDSTKRLTSQRALPPTR